MGGDKRGFAVASNRIFGTVNVIAAKRWFKRNPTSGRKKYHGKQACEHRTVRGSERHATGDDTRLSPDSGLG